MVRKSCVGTFEIPKLHPLSAEAYLIAQCALLRIQCLTEFKSFSVDLRFVGLPGLVGSLHLSYTWPPYSRSMFQIGATFSIVMGM